MSSLLTAKRMIYTGGIATVTALGAIYGAQLKDTQEAIQRREEIKKASPDEVIASLERRIQGLQRQRNEFVKKIDALDAKIARAALKDGER